MSDQPVKGTRRLTSANTPANAMSFLVEQTIKAKVNTAEIVSVNSADQSGPDGAAGYAAATPLVCQTDAFNNALPPATLPKLPFLRPQAGKAAIIMDPQPGDKAVAVFTKRDSSGVVSGKGDPVPPASFRSFDQADGFLINGFLGEKPEIWLHLNPQTGDISLSTKAAKIEISCRESGDIDISTASGNVSVTATQAINLTAPQVNIQGDVTISGTLKATGITFATHTHSGVQGGPGNTGAPNGGS